ncbi:MbnP family protein, partial [Hymenobacter sp. IS2118]|uniref:MbnP family protein n=1 Tax=Hymenobacter sp. IS2118 TaxID=1505605 RepID=UPI0029345EAE
MPASQLLALKDIPVGDYQSVSFTVGVDSARNVAGAQTGALDPNNGMFWTW